MATYTQFQSEEIGATLGETKNNYKGECMLVA